MPDDFERLVRDTLSEQSQRAPQAESTVDRVLSTTTARQSPAVRPGRSWRTWGVPLIAGGAVAAAVVAVVVAGQASRHRASPAQPTAPAPSISGLTPSARPTSATPSRPPASASGSASTYPAPPPGPAVGPVGGPVPPGFQITDLTFISSEDGWALGTAPCAQAPCTSIVRTNDGGRSWVGIRPPVVPLDQGDGCFSTPCVTSLRFATPLVGYLFGPRVLYLTTDGGVTWRQQVGGTEALEISDGKVLRVQDQGCIPGCGYRVQASVVGATAWRTVLTIPPEAVGFDTGVNLVRTGARAFVQVYGHVAGGGNEAHSALFRSADSGTTWTARGEPCPQPPTGEVDASALTTAPDGSLTVVCRTRSGGTGSFTAVSTDGGANFTPGKALSNLEPRVGAGSATVLFVVGDVAGRESLVRSGDGGRSWQVVAQGAGYPLTYGSAAGFLGFESSTVGRWVSVGDPRTVWTTRDGGTTWTPHTFR